MPLPRLPSISASRSISRRIPSFNADFTSSKKRNKKRKGASSCLIMRYLSLDEVYFDVYKGYKGEDKKRSSSARGDAIIEFATNSNENSVSREIFMTFDTRSSILLLFCPPSWREQDSHTPVQEEFITWREF